MYRHLLLAAVAVAVLVASCAPSAPSRPPCAEGKLCLEWGNGSEPVSLDPPKTTGTWEDRIIGEMIIGLTQNDPRGEAVPGMAKSWETSADGLVWTFHLRDAKWSDGVPVTADDFVFGIQRTLDPATASEYAYLIYLIKNAQAVNEQKLPPDQLGVKALDAKTVQITLNHPAPYLPELAKHQTMYPAPKHVVAKYGDLWTQPGHYVANGPYVLAEWKLGDRVRVTKNPYFYDAAHVCFDEINFYPTNDSVSAERRVRRGELDVSTDIQSNRIAFLRQPDQIPQMVRVHTYLGVTYLAFNTRDVVALRDRRVRQALTMAIDRDFITKKLLRGGQAPAYTFVPQGTAHYTTASAKPFWGEWPLEKRQAEARRLLAEAGYGPKNPLKLEIKHRNTPDPSLFMPAIQADWKQIGVQAQLVQNEAQIAYASYRNRDFQVADAAWIADYNDPKSFLDLQQSDTGAQNYGDYKNPVYDALLAKADHEPDEAKRAEYLRQAEKISLEDAPISPIYFYVNKNLVSPKITGWVDNIVDWHRARFQCLEGSGRQAAL